MCFSAVKLTRGGVNGQGIVPGDINELWFLPIYSVDCRYPTKLGEFKKFLMTKMEKDEFIRIGQTYTPLLSVLIDVVGSYL